MDKVEDKKLEALVNKMMEDARLESPSVDFTQNVMQQIEVETSNTTSQYKPVVSGKVLSLAFVAFIALLILIGSQVGVDSSQGWFKNLNMGSWFQTNWDWMGHYSSSKVMVYGFVFLGFMFFAQVPWMKKQLHKTAF